MIGDGYDAWKTDDTELDRNEAVIWRPRDRTVCAQCDETVFGGRALCAACWHHAVDEHLAAEEPTDAD